MKKIASIIAALCAATAFCGFCAACTKQGNTPSTPNTPGITNPDNSGTNNGDTGNNNTDTDKDKDKDTETESTPVIILLPGTNYNGNTKVLNTLSGSSVKALTEEEAEKYFVENAYFCTAAAGKELPTPKSKNANIEFVRWRYAVDGVEVEVSKVPEELTTDLILIAEWKKKTK